VKGNLDDALKLIFGHEGGYSNVPTDKGGPTKYGVTQRTLSDHLGRAATISDVKSMTLETAETIYRQSYAKPIRFDDLPSGLDYAVLDFAINSGPKRAVMELQEVLGVRADGWIGEATMAAIHSYPGGVRALIQHYCDARMSFLRRLRSKKTGFPVNGRGWTIRVTGKDPKGEWKPTLGVIGNALKMAGSSVPAIPATPEQDVTALPANDLGSGAKAAPDPENPAVSVETLTALGGLVTTIVSATAGSPLLQVTVAVIAIGVFAVGAYAFVVRVRRQNEAGLT
jgi:lysozyme family protein